MAVLPGQLTLDFTPKGNQRKRRAPIIVRGTSLDAFASVDASALRDIVYTAIVDAHALTCDEVEAVLKLTHQTVSARVNELANDGHIEDSGQRRPTRSGRLAIVWRPR